jgi:transcription initiation factor TFIID TATA-box-binding protein
MQKLESVLPKKIKISNIVTTADLKQKIDIEKLNEFSWGIYDQVSYNGSCGYVKTPDMKGRVTIFASGKMISIGSTTVDDSINKLNQAKFYLLTEKLIQNVELTSLVRNIVATISFDTSLNLKKLSKKIPNSVYEPDTFAGLRYRIKEGLSALIFSSGKVIIAGGKSINDIHQSYQIIRNILDE